MSAPAPKTMDQSEAACPGQERGGQGAGATGLDLLPLLRFMHDHEASDLHLSAGAPPILRLHGELKKVNHPVLSPQDVSAIARQVMNEEQWEAYAEELELDFSLDLDFARFRVNAFQQRRGPALVFRIIPSRVLSLEELGLPSVLAELTLRDKGLILVTGPTGSGKSTTLAGMIDSINTRHSAAQEYWKPRVTSPCWPTNWWPKHQP